LQKTDALEQTSKALQQELNKAASVIQNQSKEIEALKSQYDTLKITSSLLGSDENKRETKLKINSLIREIDYCIAQLAD
jgi:phage shock protein A